MKKQQLELEAKAIEESLDYPKMIKEDLKAKRKTIDQIKKKDVTKNVDEAIDAAYNKATEQSIIERHFGTRDEIIKEAEKKVKKSVKAKVRSKIKRTEEVPQEQMVTKLYHGSSSIFNKSADMPDGHRGYFAVESPEVAKKFGANIHEVKVLTDKIFDPNNSSHQKDLNAIYDKVKHIFKRGKDSFVQRLKEGNHAIFEDPQVILALKDLGYKGNIQKEDGVRVVRLLDKELFDIKPVEPKKPSDLVGEIVSAKDTWSILDDPIVAAAEMTDNGYVAIGKNHQRAYDTLLSEDIGFKKTTDGFYTKSGRFIDSKEVLRQARENNVNTESSMLRTANEQIVVRPESTKLTTDDISNFYEKELGYTKEDAIDIAKFDVEDVIPLYEKSTRKKVETIDNYKEMLDYYENIKEETKEIDYQLGERKPVELEQERHPLRETDTETVNARAKVYEEKIKGVMEDPELFTGKLVNDVNRWLNGDESVPIEQVRNGLRELAVRADELRYDFFADSPDYPSSFLNWKELVTEASEWAGKADRSKIKRTGEVTLNMGVDVTKLYDMLKNAIKRKNVEPDGKVWHWGDKTYVTDEILNEKIRGLKLDNLKDTLSKLENLESSGHGNDISAVRQLLPPDSREASASEAIVNIKNQIRNKEIYIEDMKLANKVYNSERTEQSGTTLFDITQVPLEFAKEMKKAFGRVIPYLLSPIEGRPVTRFRISPDSPKVNSVVYSGMKRKSTIIEPTEFGGEIKPGKWEPHKEKALVTNYIVEGWDPLEKKWIEVDWEKTYEDAKGSLSRHKKALEKQSDKILGKNVVSLFDITQVPAEAGKMLIEGAKAASNYVKRARAMKSFKPVQAAKMLKEEFNRSFVDRSGNIRGELLDTLGDEGYGIMQKMYLAKGASSLAAKNLKQMRSEVYDGLSRNEKRILDTLILTSRMADIGKYKSKKQFNFPKGLSPTESVAYQELFKYIEKLDEKTANDLVSRTAAYFEWMKKPLKDMLEAGLISEQEFNDLSSHNYRRLKLVDIFDKRYQTKVGKKTRTVYDSGIESLARGRKTDIFEPSSEVMALEVFNRAYGRILNNRANQELLALAKKDPNNPFVRVKEQRGDKVPSGWNRIFVYEGGERKALYISPEMSKEWVVNNPDMSYRMSQLLRYSSGSPVLRTFATGIDWGFALANLPRDVMHTWFTARTFKDGKWSPVYNSNMPVFAMQMGRDLVNVFSDAALKKGRYNDYIDQGGGMEFLVHQGRLLQRGRHVEKPIDKVYDFLGYFGETSEALTRLAIRDRVIRKRAKEQGLTIEEARKDKTISQEATFVARDYMDFGQGGGMAKALDNAFPYLNAAIQGTRGLMRSFKPGSGSALSSTYKLAQFAALTTGLYVAMKSMSPESSQALKGNVDMQNNLCIPLGDDFGFEDERGQMRYPYIKIPLDPGQKFFKTFFEASADKWLGNEVDVNKVVDSLKEMSPVGVTELPPSISGTLGYVTNKDFWLNEDIWRKSEPFSWPQSKEEYIPGKTPQAYIDFGQATGMSPERTKYAVEELITGGSMWSYLLGQGYDAAFGDMPKSKKEQHLAMTISKTPVVKRFFGVTNPYSQHATLIDKAEESSTVKRWVQNRDLDALVEGYLFEKNVSMKEIDKYISSFDDKEIEERLYDRFEFQEKTRDLPNRSFWLRLKGLNVDARARVFVDEMKQATPEQRVELEKELGEVAGIGGVVTNRFWEEVDKIESGEVR
jgi:hypothetical protein